MSAVRNDTPYSIEEVEAALRQEGVELSYRDFRVKVHAQAIREMREALAAEPSDVRRGMALSVAAALKKNYPKLLRDNFTKKVADDFYADLILRHVLKEMMQ